MKRKIHIVSFDIPFPADYGGVQDVFSRVKWFSENDWEVHLHCFEYHRKKSSELEKWAKVYYYPRPRGVLYLFSSWPFIVKTRINENLIKVLSTTNDLVLLEGLHCSWYCTLQPRKFWVRTHNIEHEYYLQLASKSKGLIKLYYRWEALKLKRFEKILQQAKGILAITPSDKHHFSEINRNCLWLPPVYEKGCQFVDTENYVLFHGNLSVEENIQAAHWFLEKIVPHLSSISFVIAGKNPPKNLVRRCQESNVRLVADPSQEKMTSLLQKAHIHVLYTQESSGIKLKLLNAISGSGFVVCNEKIIAGTGLEDYVHSANNETVFLASIQSLLLQTLTREEWEKRQNEVEKMYGQTVLKEISNLF